MDELLQIPGIGPKMAPKLRRLGFDRVADLKNADPEDMYRRYEELVGGPADRCVLYVFRCAVYFATETRHDPERLLWWAWKDDGARERRRATRAHAAVTTSRRRGT